MSSQPKGSPTEIHSGGIWALPIMGGGSQPLPGWFGATFLGRIYLIYFFRRRSAPECPFECGAGGAKAIRAMPKCPQHEFQGGFPLCKLFLQKVCKNIVSANREVEEDTWLVWTEQFKLLKYQCKWNEVMSGEIGKCKWFCARCLYKYSEGK